MDIFINIFEKHKTELVISVLSRILTSGYFNWVGDYLFIVVNGP